MLKNIIMGLAVLLTPLSVSAADVTQNIMAKDVNAIGKTSVKVLKSKIDKGHNIVILDVRTGTSWEHSKVKIKGALRIPYQEIAKRAGDIPMGSEIVTYCT
jgi:hypothetical protein